MEHYPLFRFNCRVGPHHLAYLLDRNRNAAGIIRTAIDTEIQNSEYDFEQLHAAAMAAIEGLEPGDDGRDPRSVFTEMVSTEELLDTTATGEL